LSKDGSHRVKIRGNLILFKNLSNDNPQTKRKHVHTVDMAKIQAAQALICREGYRYLYFLFFSCGDTITGCEGFGRKS
jgi:hypothetical protein